MAGIDVPTCDLSQVTSIPTIILGAIGDIGLAPTRAKKSRPKQKLRARNCVQLQAGVFGVRNRCHLAAGKKSALQEKPEARNCVQLQAGGAREGSRTPTVSR